jgi:hypothetical protein
MSVVGPKRRLRGVCYSDAVGDGVDFYKIVRLTFADAGIA